MWLTASASNYHHLSSNFSNDVLKLSCWCLLGWSSAFDTIDGTISQLILMPARCWLSILSDRHTRALWHRSIFLVPTIIGEGVFPSPKCWAQTDLPLQPYHLRYVSDYSASAKNQISNSGRARWQSILKLLGIAGPHCYHIRVVSTSRDVTSVIPVSQLRCAETFYFTSDFLRTGTKISRRFSRHVRDA